MADPSELGPLPATTVERTVTSVLDGEDAGPALVSVTFLTGPKMRGLNRRSLGRDRATDVIAFELPHDGRIVGDIYICPAVARRRRTAGVPEHEEIIRLVVHGTLHVLGYRHPDGEGRQRSAMWRRQERYVRQLTGEAS